MTDEKTIDPVNEFRLLLDSAGRGNLLSIEILRKRYRLDDQSVKRVVDSMVKQAKTSRSSAAKEVLVTLGWRSLMDLAMPAIYAKRIPHKVESLDGTLCLCLRPAHLIDYLQNSSITGYTFKKIGITSAIKLKRILRDQGLIVRERRDITFEGKRYSQCVAISLPGLEQAEVNVKQLYGSSSSVSAAGSFGFY